MVPYVTGLETKCTQQTQDQPPWNHVLFMWSSCSTSHGLHAKDKITCYHDPAGKITLLCSLPGHVRSLSSLCHNEIVPSTKICFLVKSSVKKSNKSPVRENARILNYQWLQNAIWQENRIYKIRQHWLSVWLVTMTGLALQRLSSWAIFEKPSFSHTEVSI